MEGELIMEDNKIGTTFKEGNVTLTPIESRDNGCTCKGCWYNSWTDGFRNYNIACFMHGHACTHVDRKDKKQVIFVKV